MRHLNISSLLLFSILLSCGEPQKNKEARTYQDSTRDKAILDSPENTKVSGSTYDSLFLTFECETSEIEKKTKNLEQQIDTLLSSLISKLHESKEDSTRLRPLIKLFELEQKDYKIELRNSSNIIFWAYGTASMTGERVVAQQCYYFKALQNKLLFYLAVQEKIKGTLLNL